MLHAGATAALALACLALYGFFGLSFLRSGLFHYYNALFNGDAPRVVRDLTRFDAPHGRTWLHPLLPLIGLPLGVPLAHLLASDELAALALVVVAGTTAVLCAYALFRRLTTEAEAGSMALFYALTASSLALFTQPETFVFSAAGAALMAYLMRRGAPFGARVAAALLLVGALVTNAAHVAAAEFLAPSGGGRVKLRRALKLGAVTLAVLVVLGLLELHFVPGTRVASGRTVQTEARYMPDLGTTAALSRRLVELAAHFTSYAFVAPRPQFSTHQGGDRVTFLGAWHRGIAGHGALSACVALGVLALLGWTATVHARLGRRRTETWSVAFVVAAHAALFVVYGDDLLLYSPTWVIEIVLAVALALSYAREAGLRRPPVMALYALALALGVSNFGVFYGIAGHFEHVARCRQPDHPCQPARPRPSRRRSRH